MSAGKGVLRPSFAPEHERQKPTTIRPALIYTTLNETTTIAVRENTKNKNDN